MLKASSFPLPSSPVRSIVENLDHGGRTTMAPMASLPSLRHHPESSGGGVRLLSSESFRFYACLRSVTSTSFGLCRSSSGRCFAAPLFTGRCFASVLLWRMLCRSCNVGWESPRTDALPPWFAGWVYASPPLLCYRSLHPLCCSFLKQVQLFGCG